MFSNYTINFETIHFAGIWYVPPPPPPLLNFGGWTSEKITIDSSMHGGQHCLGYWDIGFNFAWALPGYGILKLLFYFVVDESIAEVSTYSHRS